MTASGITEKDTKVSGPILERGRRPLEGGARRFVAGVSILLAAFHLYTSALGSFEVMIQRGVHLLGMLLLVFALYPARRSSALRRIPFLDWTLIALALLPVGYILLEYEHVSSRIGFFTPVTNIEVLFGSLLIVLLIEATRRTTGLTLPILMALSLLYGAYGSWWPGFLRHSGNSLEALVDQLVLQPEGIFGIILGVSSTYLVLFVILASFLTQTGAGDFFLRISTALAGTRPGGPAKIAVVASSLMGTISGQPVANVVTTGSFTIPLMMRTGYRPHFAGAVEAVASTGGQLMPPIMGAAAFVISEYIGVPYIQLARHAVLPAILYYLAVYVMVHFEAKKEGLRGMDREGLPRWQSVLLREGYLVFPIVILVLLLVGGYTPVFAGFYSIVAAVLTSFLSRRTRLDLRRTLAALQVGVQNAIQVAIVCGAAGVIIGIVALTGVGPRLGSLVISFSGGNPVLALVLTALVCIILGTGLPTTAAYIVPAALMGPALVEMGLPLVGVHLFIFYYAIISALTPPVALSAYAGAAIAGSSPWRTGFTAVRLGLTAYIVPFLFVFYPALLLKGSLLTLVVTLASAVFGVIALGAGLQGYWYGLLAWPLRLALLASAFLLILPGLLTDAGGLALLGAVTLRRWKGVRAGALAAEARGRGPVPKGPEPTTGQGG
ncbi:MAG: TRAP transporter permease [Nitrospinota bacterium]